VQVGGAGTRVQIEVGADGERRARHGGRRWAGGTRGARDDAVRALRDRAARWQRARARGRAPRRGAPRRYPHARVAPGQARRPVLDLSSGAEELMARILIVDDEPKLGRVLAEMLEGAGHDVAHVTGGRDAITRIE